MSDSLKISSLSGATISSGLSTRLPGQSIPDHSERPAQGRQNAGPDESFSIEAEKDTAPEAAAPSAVFPPAASALDAPPLNLSGTPAANMLAFMRSVSDMRGPLADSAPETSALATSATERAVATQSGEETAAQPTLSPMFSRNAYSTSILEWDADARAGSPVRWDESGINAKRQALLEMNAARPAAPLAVLSGADSNLAAISNRVTRELENAQAWREASFCQNLARVSANFTQALSVLGMFVRAVDAKDAVYLDFSKASQRSRLARGEAFYSAAIRSQTPVAFEAAGGDLDSPDGLGRRFLHAWTPPEDWSDTRTRDALSNVWKRKEQWMEPDRAGFTPLHWQTDSRVLSAIKSLVSVEWSAKIHESSGNGWTPASCALAFFATNTPTLSRRHGNSSSDAAHAWIEIGGGPLSESESLDLCIRRRLADMESAFGAPRQNAETLAEHGDFALTAHFMARQSQALWGGNAPAWSLIAHEMALKADAVGARRRIEAFEINLSATQSINHRNRFGANPAARALPSLLLPPVKSRRL